MLGRFGAYSTYGLAVAYPLAALRRTCPCSRAHHRGVLLLNVETEEHLMLPHSWPAALQLLWARLGSAVCLVL
jgi:hypothetical protein